MYPFTSEHIALLISSGCSDCDASKYFCISWITSIFSWPGLQRISQSFGSFCASGSDVKRPDPSSSSSA